MDKKELQLELDLKKWLESEKVNNDLCGKYEFCKNCDKKIENPCAEAYALSIKEKKNLDKEADLKNRKKYVSLTFQERLDKAKDETKNKYDLLKSIIEDNGFKSKLYKRNVVVRYKRILCGKISLSRNSLRFSMAFNQDDYPKIKHYDFSKYKCYEKIPFTIKFDTKKSFKSTNYLLQVLKDKIDKGSW